MVFTPPLERCSLKANNAVKSRHNQIWLPPLPKINIPVRPSHCLARPSHALSGLRTPSARLVRTPCQAFFARLVRPSHALFVRLARPLHAFCQAFARLARPSHALFARHARPSHVLLGLRTPCQAFARLVRTPCQAFARPIRPSHALPGLRIPCQAFARPVFARPAKPSHTLSRICKIWLPRWLGLPFWSWWNCFASVGT